MDEDDIEVLKESCLHDLFHDSTEKDDWSSSCQIQISSVFSLASPDSSPSLDTNLNHLHSKQFDSEAILNNLPNNPSVSSTTTEASREGEAEWTSTKQNEAPSDSIKNDDGEDVNDDAGEVSDHDPTKTTDVIEGEGSKKSNNSVKIALTNSSQTSDDVPLPEWDEVTSTTTCDPTPPSPPAPLSPPASSPPPALTPPPPSPPAPVSKFKTDLSQFFSQEPRPPVASQGGQNVIPVTGEGQGDDEDKDYLYTQRKVLVKIPKDFRNPRAPLHLAPSPAEEPVFPAKRKRGRPKGSKNKKKFVPSLSSLPQRCKRCVFLRKTRW